jgi:hypothetical protein
MKEISYQALNFKDKGNIKIYLQFTVQCVRDCY